MLHAQAKIANVVLDIGSYHTYAGEAGKQFPRFVSHSYLVQPGVHKKQQYQAGNEALNTQNTHKQIHSIFEQVGPEGKVNKFHFNINRLDKFVQTLLIDNLELDNCSINLLIAEDIAVELEHSQILKQRLKILDYLLQGMQLTNIAFVKKPVLSAFGLGRTTATVLDSGHSFTHCSIVEDGYCTFNKSIRFGGSTIHSLIRQQIQEKSNGKQFKISLENSAQPFKQSDIKFHRLLQLQNITRKFNYVPLKATLVPENNQFSYVLPDGETIKLNRNQIVDPFVNCIRFRNKYFGQNVKKLPKFLDNQSFYKLLNNFNGVQQLIFQTIYDYLLTLDHKNHTCIPSTLHNPNEYGKKKTNQLSQQDLFNNIILTGGNLNFADLGYSVEKGIRKRGGSIVQSPFEFNKDKQGNVCRNTNSLAWIGGSIICDLDIFSHFWIKQTQWKQLGGSHLLSSKGLTHDLIKGGHNYQIQQNMRRNKKLQLISKKCP